MCASVSEPTFTVHVTMPMVPGAADIIALASETCTVNVAVPDAPPLPATEPPAIPPAPVADAPPVPAADAPAPPEPASPAAPDAPAGPAPAVPAPAAPLFPLDDGAQATPPDSAEMSPSVIA